MRSLRPVRGALVAVSRRRRVSPTHHTAPDQGTTSARKGFFSRKILFRFYDSSSELAFFIFLFTITQAGRAWLVQRVPEYYLSFPRCPRQKKGEKERHFRLHQTPDHPRKETKGTFMEAHHRPQSICLAATRPVGETEAVANGQGRRSIRGTHRQYLEPLPPRRCKGRDPPSQ